MSTDHNLKNSDVREDIFNVLQNISQLVEQLEKPKYETESNQPTTVTEKENVNVEKSTNIYINTKNKGKQLSPSMSTNKVMKTINMTSTQKDSYNDNLNVTNIGNNSTMETGASPTMASVAFYIYIVISLIVGILFLCALIYTILRYCYCCRYNKQIGKLFNRQVYNIEKQSTLL